MSRLRTSIAWIFVSTVLAPTLVFGQSKLDSRIDTILSKVGRVRVLVVTVPPKLGEPPSLAYSDPASFVEKILGKSGYNIRQIAGLSVVVVETDQVGIAALAANPQIESVVVDELHSTLLHTSINSLRIPEVHSEGVLGNNYSVVILDTGVNYDHDFIGENLRAEGCFSTAESTVYSVESLCNNGLDVDLTEGAGRNCNLPACDHGTHIAGIAVGAQLATTNGDGISGVAPGAGLISIQVFTKFDDPRVCGGLQFVPCLRSFTSDQLKALAHVLLLSTSHQIAVVNMSLGSGYHSAACDSTSPLREEIEKLRESGIPTVIASGNDGYYNAVSSPGCISAAITVGASYKDRVELDLKYSNTSSLVDFLAPGTDIVSATGNEYGKKSGTSMAATHVSGIFALLKSRFPSASVDELESVLRSTAQRTFDPRTGLALYFPDARAALDELASSTGLVFDAREEVGENVSLASFRGLAGAKRILVRRGPDATSPDDARTGITRALGLHVVVRKLDESTYSIEKSAGFNFEDLSRLTEELGAQTRLYRDELSVPK